MEQLTLLFICFLALGLVIAFVIVFRKWVKHEKDIGKQIEKDYRESDAYKKTREDYINKVKKSK